MLILGIETSCDETSASIVENGRLVLSNIISSQIKIHEKTGGVVPEVAAREHVLKIIPVVDKALKEAKVDFKDIDGIAVTKGPGLISSLLIGTNTASVFSLISNKPIIPVNHIHGHIYSNWLTTSKKDIDEIKFPIIVLTISGGHNDLVLIKDYEDFQIIGETLDDAGGEAYDKVARILGLPYPGGPHLEKSARLGDRSKYHFPRAWLSKDSFDFSFSGLKTSLLYHVQKNKNHDQQFINDTCACFQEALVTVLATKLLNAAKKYNVKEIHLAGGVSANLRLREKIEELRITNYELRNIKFRFPRDFSFCTDNAGMIASAGYFKFRKNPKKFRKWNQVLARAVFEE